jgi:AraC-like DNA-binding protein
MSQISTHHPIGPSYVNIFITQDHINKVISLLIQENISFAFSPKSHSSNTTMGKAEKVTAQIHTDDKLKAKTIIGQEIGVIIKTHLSAVKDPDLTEIAHSLGLKPRIFKNSFKEIYGKPFYQYYLERKMELAANLLKTGMRASSVSKQIGYSHPIKFSKMFQKHFGLTPKKYQMSLK